MEAVSPTILNLIIFVLAIYVGYHVVWTVTPRGSPHRWQAQK